jgi:hypothetical protein
MLPKNPEKTTKNNHLYPEFSDCPDYCVETVHDGGCFAVMEKSLASSAKSVARPCTPSALFTLDRFPRRDERNR